jgi:hypothetical protein
MEKVALIGAAFLLSFVLFSFSVPGDEPLSSRKE